jgi:hypothetical protein
VSTHLSDELPRLLTGEANRDEVLAAAAHLRDCVDCQQELVSAVVAHASLTSAQRFAPEIVSHLPMGNFAARDGEADDEHQNAALPDLSAVFAQVRREADEGFTGEREPSRARHRYLIAAAAAVVVAGAGTGIYFATAGTHGESTTRTVALRAFDKGTTSAVAHIGNGTVDVTATSLPTLTAKRYEIWLTDSARTRMQPIGWIGNNGTAHLTVPSALMNRFDDLEVSVQNMGAHSYDYSGTSVLRGSIS